MIIRMSNIQWDLSDEEDFNGETLPQTIDYLVVDKSLSIDDQLDQAVDFASDQTGWCVDSCDFDIITTETES